MPLMQKFLRLKKIKLNGKAAQGNARLVKGDTVELYIPDEFFEKPKQVDAFLSGYRWHLDIVYEDQHLLLVDKRPGLLVHPDETEKVHTLVTHARAYLYQKGEYDSQIPGAFAPAPCNRIDRFTGGLVIIAKTREALDVINRKIRDHEIGKHYLCAACGRMTPPEGTLDTYLQKTAGGKRMISLSSPAPGAQRAITHYRTLACEGGLSLVECELVTGRTHQIRVQLASCGHPLLGDSQYGDKKRNARWNRNYQALYAYRLSFDFKEDAGVLSYLTGQSFSVRHVPFVKELFQV